MQRCQSPGVKAATLKGPDGAREADVNGREPPRGRAGAAALLRVPRGRTPDENHVARLSGTNQLTLKQWRHQNTVNYFKNPHICGVNKSEHTWK